MSAALDRLKQQNEPEQSQQQLGSPETMELLTSSSPPSRRRTRGSPR